MVKVKALSRSSASVQRECVGDLRFSHRNLNPNHHPMQRAREYQRALTAAKIERMFAKPFVGSLGEGHVDGVTCSAISRLALSPFVSGAADGTIALWDLPSKTCVQKWEGAHVQRVSGLVFAAAAAATGASSSNSNSSAAAPAVSEQAFYSCSTDGKIHLWDRNHTTTTTTNDDNSSNNNHNNNAEGGNDPSSVPVSTWTSSSGSFMSIDHHYRDSQFATASDESVEIWNPTRSAPIQKYTSMWGSDDTVQVVRYNPAEPNLLGSCSADRGIGLWDVRAGSALRKTILAMRSNALEWNPMEPMNFIVANEDYQTYGFDLRNLRRPTTIYKGHTSAVMDVSWSPTGREFATGSYDKTVRIFKEGTGTSRDIYHTKRMQRVFTIQYTLDNKYILSGSDDTNLRIWKARASDKVGQLSQREESAMEYRSALVKKYQHLPEVKRIHKARRIPKVITKQIQVAQIQKQSAARKLENRINNSKKGSVKHKSERDQSVIQEMD